MKNSYRYRLPEAPKVYGQDPQGQTSPYSEEVSFHKLSTSIIIEKKNEPPVINTDSKIRSRIKDFQKRGFILGEKWESTLNIPSKVLKFNNEIVYCECIIDSESQTFETRIFPKSLFSNIADLKSGMPILIKIQTKKGSTRIDVYDGKDMFDLTMFDFNDDLKDLEDAGLDQPFSL